jgi:mannose/fructose/N-acetylgalactosamine-specific phosphotransferase system component IIB
VLFRTVAAAERAWREGAQIARLTLGNVPATARRLGLTPSVHLSPDEARALALLSQAGVDVEVRTLPGDAPLPFDELRRRILDPSFSPPPGPA